MSLSWQVRLKECQYIYIKYYTLYEHKKGIGKQQSRAVVQESHCAHERPNSIPATVELWCAMSLPNKLALVIEKIGPPVMRGKYHDDILCKQTASKQHLESNDCFLK